MQLNPQQSKARDFRSGYGFVTACPGSGKTRTLTERTVSLLADGVLPENILCITFTNKAAREMRERIAKRVGDDIVKRLWISTFHSMGVKILKREIKHIPKYNSDFQIIDDKDQRIIIERAAEKLNLALKDRKNKDGIDPYTVISAISQKKDLLLSDDEFKDDNPVYICQIYDFYKDYLFKTNCMDFGDLLYVFYLLLKHKKSVRKRYSDRFKYIMVDECQDLNYCQYEIVKMLSEVHGNLLLIGDVDQSIYRFRQADPKHVFTYLEQMDVQKLPLTYNYRSTKKILKCAEALISHNSTRVADKLETTNDTGDDVNLNYFEDGQSEADWVAGEIEWLCRDFKFNYSDVAILYRVNSISRSFEQSLRMKGIPCKVVAGRSFFDYDVVKTALGYLQFYANPNNVMAFCKIINKPRRKVAEEIVHHIEEYCFENKCDLMTALRNIDNIQIKDIGDKRKESLREFTEALEVNKDKDINLVETAKRIFDESGFIDYVEEQDVKKQASAKMGKSSNMQIYESFMDMLAEFQERNENCTLDDFLQHVNLQTSADDDSDEDSVKLMTMHSSKGLEYPIVFVVNVEEGTIPHKFSMDGDDEDLEEERRLFYVGMTRAEKKLYLTCAHKRMTWGRYEKKTPSRFLKEIKKSGMINIERMF